jgi:hypothetical protein
MATLQELEKLLTDIQTQLDAIDSASPSASTPQGSVEYRNPETGQVETVKLADLDVLRKGLSENKKKLQAALKPLRDAQNTYQNELVGLRRAKEIAANPITESAQGLSQKEADSNVVAAEAKVNSAARQVTIATQRLASTEVPVVLGTTKPKAAGGPRTTPPRMRMPEEAADRGVVTGKPPTPRDLAGGGGGGGGATPPPKPGKPGEASPGLQQEFLTVVNQQFGTSFKTVNEYLSAKGVKGMAPRAKRVERYNKFIAGKEETTPEGGLTERGKQILQQEYGWVSAYIGIDPDVDAAMGQLARKEISEDAFDAKIRSSKWWQERNDFTRAWDVKERTPGSTAQKEIDDRVQSMKDYALSTFGVVLSPEQLRPWARQTLREGASAPTQENGVAAIIVKGGSQGAIDQLRQGGVAQRVNDVNARYGYNPGSDFVNQSISNIALGTMTEDMYESKVKSFVKTMYGADVGDLLDRGYSVADISEPYVQTAARMLETNPNMIDMKDTKFQKALGMVDADGKKRQMTLGEWEKTLRTDPIYGWDKTNQAAGLAVQVGEQILRQFGKVQ